MRSATQREYITPTLKPGTRYEAEVWTVSSIGEGGRKTANVSLQSECECALNNKLTLLI